MTKSSAPRSIRTSLLSLLIILCGLGLFFVFEASTAESFVTYGHQYHFVKRQALWLLVGLAALLVGRLLPLSIWEKLAPVVYVLSLILLVSVFLPGLGLELNGARRWISLGPVTFQPIELAKFGLVIFFASWMNRHQRIGPLVFLTFLPSLLLLLQPDLGSLLIIVMISFGLFYLAGGNVIKLLPVVGVAIGLLLIAILTSEYRLKRLKTFLNPDLDPQGASFHIKQITLALGSGGWLGQGLGNSRQKYAYIPEASSDSIFAIVAEEVGFVGASVILILLFTYLFLLYRLGSFQPAGSFQQLVVYGVLLWLTGQTILNLSAVVALVPLTGLPLPFFSYGGSSLVMALFANGVVLKAVQKK